MNLQKLTNVGMGTLVLGVIALCGYKLIDNLDKARTRDFVREADYQGYKVTTGVDGNGRGISIADGNAHLSAKDFQNDGRFDEIYLDSVPKGHALERFANLNDLEMVYGKVSKTIK